MAKLNRFLEVHRRRLLRKLGSAPRKMERLVTLGPYVRKVLDEFEQLPVDERRREMTDAEETFWHALYVLEELTTVTEPFFDLPYVGHMLEQLDDSATRLQHREGLGYGNMATRPSQLPEEWADVWMDDYGPWDELSDAEAEDDEAKDVLDSRPSG